LGPSGRAQLPEITKRSETKKREERELQRIFRAHTEEEGGGKKRRRRRRRRGRRRKWAKN